MRIFFEKWCCGITGWEGSTNTVEQIRKKFNSQHPHTSSYHSARSEGFAPAILINGKSIVDVRVGGVAFKEKIRVDLSWLYRTKSSNNRIVTLTPSTNNRNGAGSLTFGTSVTTGRRGRDAYGVSV